MADLFNGVEPDTRVPTDGSVTDAKVASGAAIAESKLSLASDAATGTASRRTLGTGGTQAAAGNHTHTGSGYTPPWTSQTSGAVFLAWGDGNPVYVVEHLQNPASSGSLSQNQFGSTNTAYCVKFQLPQAFSCTAFRYYQIGNAVTNAFKIGLYEGTGSLNRLLDSGNISTTTTVGWRELAFSAVSLSANTNYWLVCAVESIASGITTVKGPQGLDGTALFTTGTSGSPVFGKSIGLPERASITVSAGALPSTLPSLTAYSQSGTSAHVPWIVLLGTAS